MERLVSWKEANLSHEDLLAIFDRWLGPDFDDRLVNDQREIRFHWNVFVSQIHRAAEGRDSHLRGSLLAAALHVEKLAQELKTRTDLGIDNVMLRRVPHGFTPVITDPFGALFHGRDRKGPFA